LQTEQRQCKEVENTTPTKSGGTGHAWRYATTPAIPRRERTSSSLTAARSRCEGEAPIPRRCTASVLSWCRLAGRTWWVVSIPHAENARARAALVIVAAMMFVGAAAHATTTWAAGNSGGFAEGLPTVGTLPTKILRRQLERKGIFCECGGTSATPKQRARLKPFLEFSEGNPSWTATHYVAQFSARSGGRTARATPVRRIPRPDHLHTGQRSRPLAFQRTHRFAQSG